MRLTFYLLTAVFIQVYASGNAQNITLSGKNLTLKQVFKEVKKQTGYGLFAKKELLVNARVINLSAYNKPLKEVLDEVFRNQPLDYTIQGKNIILSRKPAARSAADSIMQAIPVKIRVVDSSGAPLTGASISLRNGKQLGVTNTDGAITLNLEEGNVIVATFIGFATQSVAVSKGALSGGNLTIRLYTSETQLKDIEITVSTGYQTLSRERSAGSFAKPDKEILQNRSTSMNILQRMDGLVPGLTINNAPGSEGVLIRGLNSINAGRAPLIVVDGIPISDINAVNPQDVADVTVLKDATAASIWGAKASNGVIVITTKKGAASENLKVDYDGFISFQGKPDLDYLPVMNSQQYIQAAKEVFDPVAYPWNTASAYVLGAVGMPPHEMILYNQYRGLISSAQANKSLDSLAAIDNRSQIKDLWYRNAALMNHTVSLRGGGKVHTFYGSLSYTDLKSNRPGATNRTYKVNLRQDFNFNKYLKVYLITDLTNITASSPRTVSADSRFYPYQLFRDADGNSLSMPYVGALTDSTRQSAQSRARIGLDYKPLDDAQLASSNTNALLNRIIGGVTLNVTKGLRYEGVFGYIRGHNKTTLYDDNSSFVQRNELVQFTVAANPAVTPVYYLPVAGGKYYTGNTIQRDWTVRNQLVFDQAWKGTLHQLTVLAGQEAQEQLLTTNESTVRGYDRQLRNAIPVDYAALALGIMNPVVANNISKSVLPPDYYRETEGQTRFTSYYANGAYTYAQRYSLNASWRVDKSNLFGLEKGAQNRPVWSTGAKWMLSDETFMQKIPVIDHLAIRATYGVTGNAPVPGTASSYNILSSATSASLPGGRSFSIATPGNPHLSWESTQTINLGIDFTALNRRLSGSVDYYNRKTDDLIGQLPVNTLTGYSVIVGNYGSLKNKGVEAVINSVNIDSRNFRWTSLLNIAYNKNEITDIKYQTPITTGQQMIDQRYFPGYSAFALFAYQYAGLDALGDPTIHLADKTVTKTRNITKPTDMLYMGTTQPPWSGGFSNTFTYKGFSLSVNAIFNLGHVMRRDVGSYFTGRLIGSNALDLNAGSYTSAINLAQGNINAIFDERWRKPGDEKTTNVPSYVSSSSLSGSRRDINYYVYGDLNVLDASYVKIRDITLSYSLPSHLVKAIKANNVTFRVQVSNLMLWKANRYGIDPEFQGFSLTSATGGDPERVYNFSRNMRTMQGIVTIGAHLSF
ncbi:SusC/RagA family TonB-linked outer membrane protein [Chitinophaga sp.]|uniref:SusC/RagA family TonB-linked outer membrane protein n=1 Tax=Chitinophaga sp. TaxID=1869181 RepID=UPI002CCA5928|nr:SusC/RagA family TonB-linked outer membrane protein [Chitinophaga sp.]HWV66222.1 SusC/RagA family TonB-linked outer membrane protein [Chitinophaga sp.]